MFKIPMLIRRLIIVIHALFGIVYLLDSFTPLSFFNISQIIHVGLLVPPTILVMLIAPSPKMMEDYKREKERIKKLRSKES